MTVSSEANIFHKISGDAASAEVGSSGILVVSIGSRAYLVQPKTPKEYFSSANAAISSNCSNEFVIRFSKHAFIPIKSLENDVNELRAACGETVEIIESYKITSKSINVDLKKRIEKRYGNKDGFEYFTITNLKPNNLSCNIHGYVHRLSQVPIPLLSISFRRKYDNVDQKSPKMNPLLQQCLKRLLVGNIVICNPHSEKAKSSVSISMPSIWSMNERLDYTVVNATPNLRKNMTKEGKRSFIYQILPSTRIILENECEDFKIKDVVVKVPEDNLVLNIIQAVRQCSNLNFNGSNQTYLNVDVPRAFFLSGPAGVGKTYQVKTAVDILNSQAETESIKLISLRGSELLSIGLNEAEAAIQLKYIFDNAFKFAQKDHNYISLIFMDECDALLSSDIIGATLGSLLDKLSSIAMTHPEHSGWKRIIVIAATNRIDTIPGYLRRPGRFDREICVPPPSAQVRYKILRSILSEVGVFITGEEEEKQQENNTFLLKDNLMNIADLTVGYVAADLSSLVRRALMLSISTKQNEQPNMISFEHLIQAMQDVGASALRDSSASTPPATTWDDIAGDAGGAKVSAHNLVCV
jgi:AAA+ superfamily predicted ATPase